MSRPPTLGPTLAAFAQRGTVYGIKVVNLGAGVLVSLLLARLGGPEALGSYSLAIQTAQLVSIVAVFGCDQLMLREIAGSLRLGRHDTANSAIGYYRRFALLRAGLVALAFAGVVLALGSTGLAIARDPALIVASGFAAANVFYLLGLGAIRGLGNPVRAQVYDGLYLVPMALTLGGLLLAGQPISTRAAVLLSTLCLLVTMAGLTLHVRQITRGWGHDLDAAFPAPRRYGLWFTLASFMISLLFWLPLFLAGALGSTADAGAFRAAWQLALPLTVIQTTTVNVLAAQVAGDLKEGRLDQAERRLHRNRLGLLALALPLAVPLLIWPEPVMLALFGPQFAGNGRIVQALVAINLFTIAAGPLNALIGMAGRDRDTLTSGVAAAVVMILLSLWLIPRLGMQGLLIGYGASVIVRTAALWQLSRAILRPSSH